MALSCIIRKSSNLCGIHLKSISRQLLKSATVTSSIPRQFAEIKSDRLSYGLVPNAPNLRPSILARNFSVTPVQLSQQGHDHVTIWKLERVLSIALLGLIPAALLAPCKVLDTAVALSIVMHNHWGLEAIVVDYVRPILFGEIGPKIGMGLLYLFSVVTLAGLLNLIYNDAGLANSVLQIWKL